MNTLNRVVLLVSFFVIASCGGGGGGGGSEDSYTPPAQTNSAPTITNTVFNISVQENQTSAFTISASDPDGDSLTYSLSGTDSALLSVSSSGVVTFNTAPDYENPSDSNSDNVYGVTATVSDGSLTDSESFMITVTNDTSDDVTTEGYDGTLVAAGPVQGATVCIQVNTGTCTGAQFTTTSAQDGTFSLTVDSGTTGVLRGEGGFDPVTNLQFGEGDSLALGQPVTDQNVVISAISEIMNEYNSTDYDSFKTKLGIDPPFTIRFDNPFDSLGSASSNKAAVVNTQLLVLHDVIKGIHTFSGNVSIGGTLTYEDVTNIDSVGIITARNGID